MTCPHRREWRGLASMMRSRHRGAAAVLAVVLVGAQCSHPTAPVSDTPLEAFDFIWETFDAKYPFFELKHTNWAAQRATFRPQAENATDVLALNAILLQMLAPLNDLHVSLESPSGQRILTYQPADARNWNQQQWQEMIASADWTQIKPNLGRGRIDGVPYLAVGSWNSTQFTVEDLDAAIEPFRDEEAIIIDVRANGGGNDALALALARRFTDRTVVTETFRVRTGPEHDDLGDQVTRTVSPRGPWTFAGRVYVLSGRGVFSSNESFIAAMREVPRGTIVGDTTGGATANPQPTEYLSGWKVWVSTWLAATPDGKTIEGMGIAPDVHVAWSASSRPDPVVAAAVALAKHGSSAGAYHER